MGFKVEIGIWLYLFFLGTVLCSVYLGVKNFVMWFLTRFDNLVETAQEIFDAKLTVKELYNVVASAGVIWAQRALLLTSLLIIFLMFLTRK